MATDLATVALELNANGLVTGAARGDAALKKLSDSGTRVEQMAAHVQSAITALGGALALREIIQYADTWRLIQGRLALVTDSTGELIAVQSQLFHIAQRTRSEYEGVAALYTKVAQNAEQLGRSQAEMLRFTELTTKSIQIGGASSSEAANGVRQLGQALASGVLRGDEFNSIAENMTGLQQTLAAGLGVTTGELRKMAQEGKLTADVVVASVLKMSEQIDRDFANVPLTVGQSFAYMRNEIMRTIGEIDAATGASSTLSSVVRGLADHIDALVTIGQIAAIVFGAKLVSSFVASTAGAWAQVSAMSGLSLVFGAATAAATTFDAAIKALGGPVGLFLIAGGLLLKLLHDIKRDGLEEVNRGLEESTRLMNEYRQSIEKLTSSQIQSEIARLQLQLSKLADLPKPDPVELPATTMGRTSSRMGGVFATPSEETVAQWTAYNEVQRQSREIADRIIALRGALPRQLDEESKAAAAAAKAYRELTADMRLELARITELNKAHGQTALALRMIEIRHDAVAERSKNARDHTKAETDALNALTEQYAEQQRIAARLEDAKRFKDNSAAIQQEIRDTIALTAAYDAFYPTIQARESAIAELRRQQELENSVIEQTKGLSVWQAAAREKEIRDLARLKEARDRAAEASASRDAIAALAQHVAMLGRQEKALLAGEEATTAFNRAEYIHAEVLKVGAKNWEEFAAAIAAAGAAFDAGERIRKLTGDVTQAVDPVQVAWEEAARGIQQALAAGFQESLTDLDAFADSILNVFQRLSAQIAAAMASEALGIDKLLKTLEESGIAGLTKGQARLAAGAAGFGIGYGTQSLAGGALAGAASGAVLGGPVGAAIGALAGMTGGILGASEAAKDAAEQQREMRREIEDSISALQLFGNSFGQAMMRISADYEAMIARIYAAYPVQGVGGVTVGGRTYGGSDPDAAERQRKFDQAAEWANEQARRAVEQMMIDKQRAEQDYQIRALRADGYEQEASYIAFIAKQQRELDDARRAGTDITTLQIALAKELTQYEQQLADAREKAARAADSALNDLQVRYMRANGQTADADRTAFVLGQQREIYEALEKNSSAAYMEFLQLVQGLELVAFETALATAEQERQAEAAREQAAALRSAREAMEDLDVRMLRASGQGDAADLQAFINQQAREFLDAITNGMGSDYLARLFDVQGAELIAFQAEQAARAAKELADSLAELQQQLKAQEQAWQDLHVRELRLTGNDAEANRVALLIQQQRELDDATAKGFSEAYIAQLKWLHGIELGNLAAEELARTAKLAAEAAEEAKRAEEERARAAEQQARFVEDLNARMYDALGRSAEAAIARMVAAQRREVMDAQSAGYSPATMGLLQAVHVAEMAALRQQQAIDAQTKIMQAAAEAEQAAYDAAIKTAQEQLSVAKEQLSVQEAAVNETRRVVESMRTFSDSLKLGNLTTLSPIAQLAEARRQFDAAAGAAQGGNRDEALRIPELARAFLEASRNVNASGLGYVRDFTNVQQVVDAIGAQYAGQLTIEERMLDELKRHTTALEKQIEALQAAKDQAAEDARAAIEALQNGTGAIVVELAGARAAADAHTAQIIAQFAQATGFAPDDLNVLRAIRDDLLAAMDEQLQAARNGATAQQVGLLEQIAEIQQLRFDSSAGFYGQIQQLRDNGTIDAATYSAIEAQRSAADKAFLDQIAVLREQLSATHGTTNAIAYQTNMLGHISRTLEIAHDQLAATYNIGFRQIDYLAAIALKQDANNLALRQLYDVVAHFGERNLTALDSVRQAASLGGGSVATDLSRVESYLYDINQWAHSGSGWADGVEWLLRINGNVTEYGAATVSVLNEVRDRADSTIAAIVASGRENNDRLDRLVERVDAMSDRLAMELEGKRV